MLDGPNSEKCELFRGRAGYLEAVRERDCRRRMGHERMFATF